MNTRKLFVITAGLLCLAAFTLSAEPASRRTSLTGWRWEGVEFGSYASLGGGAAWTTDGVFYPVIADASSGFQLRPWLALGAYCSVSQLSDISDLSFGTPVVSFPGAFALATGSELIITPWAERIVHPYLRLSIGGRSVGELVDTDGKEGFETVSMKRYFNAGAAAGAEVNLSEHVRLYGRAGVQYTNNDRLGGISAGKLSGVELCIGGRFIWRTGIR